MSWNDQIEKAKPGRDRAQVYLRRALQRGSKRLVISDISQAILESGSTSDLHDLVSLYKGASYSLDGLKRVARCFLGDMQNKADWRAYHAPRSAP